MSRNNNFVGSSRQGRRVGRKLHEKIFGEPIPPHTLTVASYEHVQIAYNGDIGVRGFIREGEPPRMWICRGLKNEFLSTYGHEQGHLKWPYDWQTEESEAAAYLHQIATVRGAKVFLPGIGELRMPSPHGLQSKKHIKGALLALDLDARAGGNYAEAMRLLTGIEAQVAREVAAGEILERVAFETTR